MYRNNSCRSSPQTSLATTAAEVGSVTTPHDLPYSSIKHSTIKYTDVDAISCSSEFSSESEEAPTSRPSNTSISTTSANTATTLTFSVAQRVFARKERSQCGVNSDVRLLNKIGFIASRVRFLSKIYGDFRLINPYSPAKQRKQIREIQLKHSIIDTFKEISSTEKLDTQQSLTPLSSAASSYCYLPTESSYEDDTIITASKLPCQPSTTAKSILLLEDLLIQFYEDRKSKITVIGNRHSRRNSSVAVDANINSNRNHLIIMSSKTASSSVEPLVSLGNDNEDDDSGNTYGGTDLTENIKFQTKNSIVIKANTTLPSQQQQQRYNTFLQPSSGVEDNLRRRRASDCSTHPGQALSTQLQISLKNNNCTKFPFHRGSCGAAGEHLLAANSIANRSTIILSKSCSNVDGTNKDGLNSAFYKSSDFQHKGFDVIESSSVGGGGAGAGGGGGGGGGTPSGTGTAATGSGITANNGNNEYSIIQLNNTIIRCHFNDDDFRALVKDLKRKVEYTERMNWLCE
ncbi:high affinity cGMP-specific 3',5'-cyclic phosphodiesterase 9A-like [Teleopsis dalmanni]|uniref:high affinity cGMP-specific 3',5'-cyclic phosphodiesterase 9A-like n=1 Tax=Teleopsis dalmanni TaxID=139649 RepID=UPI0018CE1763|nr:high affinity cGMP-specific 3',5'-cyclic phosphodiesterase 9A-like [Teleopsis dalmanni]XP_037931416.1 high affinity cGMP-specific 3',5'-cyclic phosphodiesterase 9A-like [Teleopsis dalmanni]